MIHDSAAMRDFRKDHEYLICIDSDGCAFDSMELKHKECFVPNFINHWNLQIVAKQAREVWEFVNLYSQTRGCNRFHALMRSLSLLASRPEVQKRGFVEPDLSSLREWVKDTEVLSNYFLKKAADESDDPVLRQAYRWSSGINRYVEEIVRGVPPFYGLNPALEKGFKKADLMVVSATPMEALVREWTEHGIAGYMKLIAGQEMGTKAEQIAVAIEGRYSKENVLKIGDAPGDLAAAKANSVLFYPIIPGKEEESWKIFTDEIADRFFEGDYAGDCELSYIAEFNRSLPEKTPWD
jgi:phosphoglycolate phosphatase-like HAD superfamily hydrolase